MPYSVTCKKCKRTLVVGASTYTTQCSCGDRLINYNQVKGTMYLGCNQDGSKITGEVTTAVVISRGKSRLLIIDDLLE